jgi:tRNA (guanine-N7-)-methyltransferase
MPLRKHCNPFAFRRTVLKPDYSEIFENWGKTHPLEVDIGCGSGHFLRERAEHNKHNNFLGLEVREAYCLQFNKYIEKEKPNNLALIQCNANRSLELILEDETVSRFHIYFPDPWFKNRHHKRRIVTPDFAEILRRKLIKSGDLLIKSDVPELANQMLELLEAVDGFENAAGIGNFVGTNWPVPEVSKWESHLFSQKIAYQKIWLRKK